MSAGNWPEGIRARQHRQAEREGHAGEADAQLRKGGCEHGTAATAKHQPERANEFGEVTTHDQLLGRLLPSQSWRAQKTDSSYSNEGITQKTGCCCRPLASRRHPHAGRLGPSSSAEPASGDRWGWNIDRSERWPAEMNVCVVRPAVTTFTPSRAVKFRSDDSGVVQYDVGEADRCDAARPPTGHQPSRDLTVNGVGGRARLGAETRIERAFSAGALEPGVRQFTIDHRVLDVTKHTHNSTRRTLRRITDADYRESKQQRRT